MSDESRTRSIWRKASATRLSRRFTIMGASLAALAVLGLLALKAFGVLSGGQNGGSAGCGLAIKSAEAHEAGCKEPNGKLKPAP